MTEGKRKKLDPLWINKVLDCSEEVGISRAIIERFHYYYIKQRRVDSAKSSQITTRTKSSKN